MGLILSRIWLYMDKLGARDTRILMVGLDMAGKTTVLYKLKLNEALHTIPTVGFNVEELEYKQLRMTIWDIGGQSKLRKLWRYYYQGTDAIIFIIDASDLDRIEEAKYELANMLSEDQLRNSTLLVFANKMDIPHALSASQLATKLDLDSKCRATGRQWYIQSSCATSGEGLYEGLDWLDNALKNQRKHQNSI